MLILRYMLEKYKNKKILNYIIMYIIVWKNLDINNLKDYLMEKIKDLIMKDIKGEKKFTVDNYMFNIFENE